MLVWLLICYMNLGLIFFLCEMDLRKLDLSQLL